MKIKLTLITILLICVLGQQNAMAQETQPARAHEIYLYGDISSFSLTGMTYKSELKNDSYFRIGTTNLSFRSTSYDFSSEKYLYISSGIKFGLEKRIRLTEKLSAFYGIDLNASVSFQKNSYEDYFTKYYTLLPGISFGSGFILNVFRNFSVAFEAEPSILVNLYTGKTISESTTTTNKTTTCSFDFDSDNLKLALIYKW